jgi:hypothetical protein
MDTQKYLSMNEETEEWIITKGKTRKYGDSTKILYFIDDIYWDDGMIASFAEKDSLFGGFKDDTPEGLELARHLLWIMRVHFVRTPEFKALPETNDGVNDMYELACKFFHENVRKEAIKILKDHIDKLAKEYDS